MIHSLSCFFHPVISVFEFNDFYKLLLQRFMKLTLFIESDFLICLLFDIIFRFTSICPHITENIVFNALKPIPFNSTICQTTEKENQQTD